MSLIRLNDVSMDYDGRPVLKEAFLKLRKGDRVGLIGKNGTELANSEPVTSKDSTMIGMG